MYKKVYDWVNSEICSDGESFVLGFVINPIDEALEIDKKLYPVINDELEDINKEYKQEGATHVARVLLGTEDVGLVDGVDIFFTILNGTLLIISELDTPAYSGPFAEGMDWVKQRVGDYLYGGASE